MKPAKFSFTLILDFIVLHLVLKSTAMRLPLLITLLLSATIARAQLELVYDAKPDVHVNRVGDKTNITTNGGFQHGQIIDVMIIGVIDEFRHREAIWDEQEANHGIAPMTYFISNDSLTIDFLPTKTNEADLPLPVYPHAEEIDYREIDVMVTKNEVPLYDWKPVSALLPDKEYEVSFTGAGQEKPMPWPSLQVGKFKLAVGDKLKVHIRRKGTDKTVQYIYVERVKAVPEPVSIHQFPNNASVQDILNKEHAKASLWLINADELEIDPGHSLLLGFDREPFQKKIIEYAFTDDPSNWKPLKAVDEVPSMTPYYLFIEKPEAGYKRELLLRYEHQRESILHIKISVKPRTTTTNWIKITAGIALAVLLFITGFYFNRKKNTQKLKRLTLKKEELESKLQLLSGQLNPHFLFNSLNSIQNLVNKEEAGKASNYLSEVAVFLRTVMDAGKKEYISLQEELHIAESYLKLEQKRKPFQYSIEYSCAVGATQLDFPPLLLQPVLENCIHHGFKSSQSDSLLTINIRCEGKNIMISVGDNGNGFDISSIEYGQGLSLVKKRIALMNEKLGYAAIDMKMGSGHEGTITTFTLQNWI